MSKCLLLSMVVLACGLSVAAAQPDYTLFEADPVRPLAMSPDGTQLFAANTPDAHLEIYDLTGEKLQRLGSVPVGLEPVAIAAPTNDRVWVVNHLSDSISIVDVAVDPPRVVRTLLLGDEPRDIVFAGPDKDLAFVTTAHRGQNTPWPDGDYDVPGVGRADVWVYDSNNLGSSLEGNPLTVIRLFADRPRALAVSPDGLRVYAAAFRSGNQTVAVSEGLVCDGAASCELPPASGNFYPGGLPLPTTNRLGIPSRQAGLIVGFDQASSEWRDELGRDWSLAIPFDLPDLDVFEIDASAAIPQQIGAIAGVGTILFNMIVDPVTDDVYITNTDANNRVRFEGFGDYVSDLGPKLSGDPPSVRGELAKSRITVLDASSDNVFTPATEFSVTARHLNKHIPYGVSPVPAGVKEKSVATPMGMAITSDGGTLYVAAFGSNAVVRYSTSQVRNDTFVPNAFDKVSLERPSAVVLDEARDRLYVSNTSRIYVVDTNTFERIQIAGFHTPESSAIVTGRRFLYDANATSSNGESSCSSCHIFGDMDDLSWDLGDPDANPFENTNPPPTAVNFFPVNNLQPFDPQKGPMTTQSLRGMVNAGPMHWRGDRTGPACATIDTARDPACERQAFLAFNVAFPGLLGRDEGELAAAEIQAFADFALALTYPPNPIRALDNSLTTQQAAGATLYNGRITDGAANCDGCHTLNRSQGFFGTSGGSTFEAETMEFKVPHLRNAYQKVGMFGQMPSEFFSGAPGIFTGDQVRGTGFLHDGAIDTVFDFLSADVFDNGGLPNDNERRNLEAFIMAFDSDLAPIVGQQVTLAGVGGLDVDDRISLMIERADAIYYTTPGGIDVRECDLIVKGVVDGVYRGWQYLGSGDFKSDKAADPLWSRADLEAEAAVPGQALTFSCVPPGSGLRMGIDRDGDRKLDGDDPAPTAKPRGCSVAPVDSHETVAAALAVVLLCFVARRLTHGRSRSA